MAGYRLSVDRPVASDMRRIAQKQLARAERELAAASRRFSETRVHTARKRLKKVRALLRLVRPALGKTYRRVNRPLRRISHRLGAISDAAATVNVVALLRTKYRRLVAPATARNLQRLLAQRERLTDSVAGNRRALAASVRLLRAERRRAAHWMLHGKDFAAIAGGLERTFRAGRRASRRAEAHPTAARVHLWRRRAKDQWLQLRLLDARCAHRLRSDTRALDALDGVLGAYHDLALLTEVLEADTRLPRQQCAAVLRAVARERRRLRRRAHVLAGRVYREKPKAFVRRVEHLWQAL